MTYPVWCDHRENPKVRAKIQALEGVEYIELQLPVGDLILPEANIAIERKSCSDFIGSVYDSGKVFRQLEELKTNYKNPILVIHGDMFEYLSWQRGDAHRAHMTYLSAMVAVARMGIPIISCRTDDEYLETILILVKQTDPNRPPAQRPIETRKSADRTIDEEQSDVLCAIKGIGRKAAKNLLNSFGSPLEVFKADAAALVALDGVGKKTADHILEVGRTKYVPTSES